MSIGSLDAKCSLHLLPSCYENTSHNVNEATCKPYAGGTLWEIENFLSHYEIMMILDSCKDNYDFLQYRNSYRCIAIDSNMILSNLITSRLKQHNFLDKLNGVDWKPPRGFCDGIDWLPNTGTVNSCIRINKYINSQFDYHRDAPLTCNPQLKSNYTLIIYLNNEYDGGHTEFLLPTIQYEHNGLSMKEELHLIGKKYNTIEIKPMCGKAIIFEHGVIHKSNMAVGTKYVLRTDLLCRGIQTKHKSTPLYKSLEILTKKLFRQAQLNELKSIKDNDLYERCLSLRMNPNNIISFPTHLEKYLDYYQIDKSILSSLKLLSRNSSIYTFEYNTLIDDKFSIIKNAIIFALNTLTLDITDQLIATFNENMFGDPIIHVNEKYQNRQKIVTPRVQKILDIKKSVLERSKTSLSKRSTKTFIKVSNELEKITTSIIDNRTYFSDSMGKYNMLEDIPDQFINGLANALRVRSSGNDRSAFDLTNSVLINDSNLNRMAKSKVTYRVGTDVFSDLPLNFFDKDFDSSLHETLRRLFVDFDLKFDDAHVKQLEFDELGTLVNKFPVHTIIQLIGRQYAIHIRKTMYSHHNNNYYDTRHINNSDAFCFHSFKFATTVGTSQLNFHNVVFDNGTIKGNVTINSPTRYFNHAGCQSDVVDEYIRDIKKVNKKPTMKYIILEHKASFVMQNGLLTITIVPNVIL